MSDTHSIELSVGGMTCASCSRRVERSLQKIDGVTADVNYATGSAYVSAPDSVSAQQLLDAIEKVGYTAQLSGKAAEHFDLGDFRIRLIVGSAVTIPVMALSMISTFQFSGWQWLVGLLVTPIATWGAWPFHRAALLNIRHRAVTMDTLVSLGVGVAYLWSVWALFFTMAGDIGMRMSTSIFSTANVSSNALFFEVASSVTTLVVLGKYLEHRARAQSLRALENLAQLNPRSAQVLRDGNYREVLIEDVVVGDVVFVAAGAQIPVDGTVLEGSGHVDKSLVTGESVPVEVSQGSAVIGATVLLDSSLVVRADAVGRDSVLSGISRLVHQAQSGKAEVTRLVDRVSEVFVPVVICLAIGTAVVWQYSSHSAATSLSVGIAVLVIACPCALGLATPTALLVGTGRGAQLGILIRGPHAIESSEKIDMVFLDKTGTLTNGRLTVADVFTTIAESDLWSIVDALEATSSHPLATSLRAHAEIAGVHHSPADKVHVVSGSGVQGLVDGHPCALGSVRWLGAPVGEFAEHAEQFADRGYSVVVVYRDARAVAVIGLADTIAESTKSALADLRAMGISPVVISGDHDVAVRLVCAELGVSDYVANASPEDKLVRITNAQESGHHVAMIGDGVNDAAALAKAHLSIAMGEGTDVAANSADVVLLNSSMAAAVIALRLSRATMGTIRLNLFWAFAYNVAAIPLAMTGRLGPIIGSGAMAFSSVFVVTNSLRLRNFHNSNESLD